VSIETSFIPQTVNELMLLERIHELRLASYKNGNITFDTPVAPITLRNLHPTVTLAAELHAGWESDFRFAVNATAHLDKQDLHFGYYLHQEIFNRWAPERAANQLSDMHQTMIRQLVASLK
jgi:hypothetical protein